MGPQPKVLQIVDSGLPQGNIKFKTSSTLDELTQFLAVNTETPYRSPPSVESVEYMSPARPASYDLSKAAPLVSSPLSVMPSIPSVQVQRTGLGYPTSRHYKNIFSGKGYLNVHGWAHDLDQLQTAIGTDYRLQDGVIASPYDALAIALRYAFLNRYVPELDVQIIGRSQHSEHYMHQARMFAEALASTHGFDRASPEQRALLARLLDPELASNDAVVLLLHIVAGEYNCTFDLNIIESCPQNDDATIESHREVSALATLWLYRERRVLPDNSIAISTYAFTPNFETLGKTAKEFGSPALPDAHQTFMGRLTEEVVPCAEASSYIEPPVGLTATQLVESHPQSLEYEPLLLVLREFTERKVFKRLKRAKLVTTYETVMERRDKALMARAVRNGTGPDKTHEEVQYRAEVTESRRRVGRKRRGGGGGRGDGQTESKAASGSKKRRKVSDTNTTLYPQIERED
ncbi:hypothetical protein LTR66_004359 [Elasticomyces elasticus]|nr:hypothetical protein LTR66_004359 [Elasticomyces elasticus]